MSNETEIKKDKKKDKKPTIWGVAGYALIILALGILAIFSKQFSQMVKGPVLCIYIAVLPKYIFGLALILAGTEGVVYTLRFFKDDPKISLILSGIQVTALAVFLFFIFPLAIREGVPVGSTYNIMRILIGVMLLVTIWDFGSEIRSYIKTKKTA